MTSFETIGRPSRLTHCAADADTSHSYLLGRTGRLRPVLVSLEDHLHILIGGRDAPLHQVAKGGVVVTLMDGMIKATTQQQLVEHP